jgi:hypothetical protein
MVEPLLVRVSCEVTRIVTLSIDVVVRQRTPGGYKTAEQLAKDLVEAQYAAGIPIVWNEVTVVENDLSTYDLKADVIGSVKTKETAT